MNSVRGLRETLFVLHLSETTYLDSFRDLNKGLMDLDAFVKRLSSLLMHSEYSFSPWLKDHKSGNEMAEKLRLAAMLHLFHAWTSSCCIRHDG